MEVKWVSDEDSGNPLRGKCREYSLAAIESDPTLRIAKGFYYCDQLGRESHWWTAREDGSIFDPTASQFPSNGNGKYVEFVGAFICDHCGSESQCDNAKFYVSRDGNEYVLCSDQCLDGFKLKCFSGNVFG